MIILVFPLYFECILDVGNTWLNSILAATVYRYVTIGHENQSNALWWVEIMSENKNSRTRANYNNQYCY